MVKWLLHTVCMVALLIGNNNIFANPDLPSCSQISADEDGDGYGYENGRSCIIDTTTSLVPIAGECVDDNADGWGWNGIESCEVAVTVNTECEDTDPKGDGWGWNGSSSCRVVPATTPAYNELDHLKSLLVTVTNKNQKLIGMYCSDTDETFYLLINGWAEHYIGTALEATGMWTTGLYDEDGIMSMVLDGRYYSFGTDRNTRDLIISGRRCVFFQE